MHAAIGTIIGRIVHPGSDLATYHWLQNQSGRDELIGCDFDEMSLYMFYQATDLLLKNKKAIESHLYQKEKIYSIHHINNLSSFILKLPTPKRSAILNANVE